MAFRIDNASLRSFIEHKGWGTPEPDRLHGIGIRGALPYGSEPGWISLNGGNEPDRVNDVVGLWGRAWFLAPGSVDPGLPYTNKPLNPKGAAHLCDGGPYLFRLGSHKGHRALKQASAVRVWRDGDRDWNQDVNEIAHLETGIGIDLHAGPIGQVVGKWSAGCQVVAGGWQGHHWQTFLSICEAELPKQGGVLRYWLITASELYQFLAG